LCLANTILDEIWVADELQQNFFKYDYDNKARANYTFGLKRDLLVMLCYPGPDYLIV
jgi:hypothetical protein